jgi:hypothetical protein
METVFPGGGAIVVQGPDDELVEYSHKYVILPVPPVGVLELVIVAGSNPLQPDSSPAIVPEVLFSVTVIVPVAFTVPHPPESGIV